MERVYEGALSEPLAGRAEPRAAAADDDALDRRPAAVARLAEPPVDVELPLHPALRAVRGRVLAEGRPLELDPLPQGGTDGAVQPRELVAVELARRPPRVDAGAPER